ncbi:MAG TPA: CoA ester lyase [Acetobacteraceae bacterium]|nr:CoA ester lyase [Acetobacteraceae bacterium]
MRSLLFVPADSERKLAKGRSSGASGLILDLEDSVAAHNRPTARKQARAALEGPRTPELWVRINPIASDDALLDLAAVMPGKPRGILLPKCTPADLRRLDDYLSALEIEHGVARFATKVIAIATETGAGVFRLGEYGGVTPRLAALTWGAEDLAAVLGATNRRPDGVYDDTFRLVRALCVIGAQAAGVEAIDTIYADFRDEAGLREECQAGRRAGFTGKMAIHPAQLDPINETFSPNEEELTWARDVVAAFAANPDAGTIGLAGKMVDRPHLVLAQRLLSRAG